MAQRILTGVSHWHFSWLAVLALVLVAAIAIPALNATTGLFSGGDIQVHNRLEETRQQLEVIQGAGSEDTNPAEEQDPSAQNEPVVTYPFVDYEVTWTEVKGFDPSTIPTEEGFYSGKLPTSVTEEGPYDPNNIPEGDAFTFKIFPYLEGGETNSFVVAAARAQDDKTVVFANIKQRYLLNDHAVLSVDGEEFWCFLGPPLIEVFMQKGLPSMNDQYTVVLSAAVETRVTLEDGGQIHLYVKDSRPGNHWWEAVVSKSELPCS